MTKVPFGLNKKEMEILQKCSIEYAPKSLDTVLKKSSEYFDSVRKAASENSAVNLRLANAILERIQKIPKFRNQLSTEGLFWIKGGAAYFFMAENAHILSSFEDHTEVWNACAKIAGLDELSIWMEDFN
ncbi:MAG TPA: hypothetical protein PK453_05680 [Leptospiraceae bacterium]|nr:hypothetical protein [Leptospiraceae bacterium]HMY67258.1 hypothetical protein [Leptospiraceae bacterium]HNF13140.1 hypothetical protein [Leptospiraceae bacterium]HNH07432.1 hypothetical protein [Leptospiraceae bacterium]HNI27659.1 hypothetical protein [Leptospiraceae bacterium]